jgi:hypothetical protein
MGRLVRYHPVTVKTGNEDQFSRWTRTVEMVERKIVWRYRCAGPANYPNTMKRINEENMGSMYLGKQGIDNVMRRACLTQERNIQFPSDFDIIIKDEMRQNSVHGLTN